MVTGKASCPESFYYLGKKGMAQSITRGCFSMARPEFWVVAGSMVSLHHSPGLDLASEHPGCWSSMQSTQSFHFLGLRSPKQLVHLFSNVLLLFTCVFV